MHSTADSTDLEHIIYRLLIMFIMRHCENYLKNEYIISNMYHRPCFYFKFCRYRTTWTIICTQNNKAGITNKYEIHLKVKKKVFKYMWLRLFDEPDQILQLSKLWKVCFHYFWQNATKYIKTIYVFSFTFVWQNMPWYRLK